MTVYIVCVFLLAAHTLMSLIWNLSCSTVVMVNRQLDKFKHFRGIQLHSMSSANLNQEDGDTV